MTTMVRTIRILIIDDDHDFANTQVQYLKDHGYEAIALYTVESARDYLQSNGSEVSIALVDMVMARDGVAGLNLVQLMSTHYPWIVSIIVTAYADYGNAVKCMQAGAFTYISKGAAPQALITETVKKAAEKFRLRSRLATIRPSVIEIKKVAEEILQKAHDIEEMLLRITDEVDVESDRGEDTGASIGRSGMQEGNQ